MTSFSARVSTTWDALKQDLRYTFRTWRRAPAPTVLAILTLAIGIAAVTAIFALTDAVILRPFPVERPDELRVLHQSYRVRGVVAKEGTEVPVSLYQHLRSRTDVFSGAAAFVSLDEVAAAVEGRELQIPGGAVFVSDNYFTVLGVAPRLGRGFNPGEDLTGTGTRGGDASPALISHGFWRRAFEGGDVLGRVVRVGGANVTIVGVTPPGFFGAILGRAPDLFMPLGTFAAAQPGIVNLGAPETWTVHVVGRLRPAMTDADASNRLTALARAVAPARPATSTQAHRMPPPTIEVRPIETGLSDARATYVRPLGVLLAMAALLLFIACANVGLLRLSQGMARQAELGIRIAIGAPRRRLLQQIMTEGLVLAAAAGALGLFLAPRAIDLLLALLPPGAIALALDVTSDPRVLLFTAAISTASVLLFGLPTARHASRLDANAVASTRERGAVVMRSRLGSSFVVIQVAISLVVLGATGLLIRTLDHLANVDTGYRADGVLLVTVEPAKSGYRGERLDMYYRTLLDRVGTVAGVQSATLTQATFLSDIRTTGGVEMPGFTDPTDERHWVQVFQVGPRFFETLGMRVVQGRDFLPQDMEDGPMVAAINQAAARRYFGNENPIGRMIKSDSEFQIVAVVGDARHNELRQSSNAALFVPYRRVRQRGTMVLAARLTGDETHATSAVLGEVRAIDRLVRVRAATLTSLIEQNLSRERLLAVISGFFGGATALLMAIGLASLVSLRAQQRVPEIGMRLALGARKAQVIWLVLRQPLWLAALGSCAGLPMVLAAGRLMRALLFGVSPTDLATLSTALLAVFLIVTAGASLPAWRASRVDPLKAVREQ